MKIAIVVPHFFMNDEILPNVIFSPGNLAIDLINGLTDLGAKVTLFSPGKVKTKAKNITADLSYFDEELNNRGYDYLELLKKHPLVFVSLARQAQSEIISKAFEMANNNDFDCVLIYTNEEDTALPFVKFCNKPVFLSHHDPFSFLIKYKNILPKYKDLNWISFSIAQRKSMPSDTNWVTNIYHGLNKDVFKPVVKPSNDYFVYLGRIIRPKGVSLAIDAVNKYNKSNNTNYKLKIAGKHYSEYQNDTYWTEEIEPKLSSNIEYIGVVNEIRTKNQLIANAKAILVPSLFEEPFGMVIIEAFACGTPVIALDSGSTKELITNRVGIVSEKVLDNNSQLNLNNTIENLAKALDQINMINRKQCRKLFEQKYTTEIMCRNYLDLFSSFIK